MRCSGFDKRVGAKDISKTGTLDEENRGRRIFSLNGAVMQQLALISVNEMIGWNGGWGA